MKQSFEGRFNDTFWALWEEKIVPYLSDSPVVLDLGAGPGLFLRALVNRYPNAKAYGVECAPYMLEAVEDLPPNAQIIDADLHDPHLPLADNSVDEGSRSIEIVADQALASGAVK